MASSWWSGRTGEKMKGEEGWRWCVGTLLGTPFLRGSIRDSCWIELLSACIAWYQPGARQLFIHSCQAFRREHHHNKLNYPVLTPLLYTAGGVSCRKVLELWLSICFAFDCALRNASDRLEMMEDAHFIKYLRWKVLEYEENKFHGKFAENIY